MTSQSNRPIRIASLTAFIALAYPPWSATAQTLEIPATPSCSTCRIVIDHLVTLGSIADADSPAAEFVVTRDSRGRTFVAPMTDHASVGVYDGSGSCVDVIGRPGAGPGEFTYAQEVKVIAGDTIIIVDRVQSRYTVYDPQLNLVDVVNVPFPDDGSVFFDSRSAVFHASVGTAERLGYLLHQVRAGTVVRSFAEIGDVVPDNRFERHRRIAPGPDGSIWLARENDYTIELWDTTGTRRKLFHGDRSWFPAWNTRRDANRERPWPQVNAIWQDENGVLFVLVAVPSAEWRPGILDEVPPRTNLRVRQDVYMDTVIEAIDPGTGELLASLRTDTLLNAGLMDKAGIVDSRAQDAAGWVRVDISRVHLVRNSHDGTY